jgi:hypothetical protein
MSRHMLFGSAATAAVVIAIALGFWNLGGPARQRDVSADQHRSLDLTRVSSAIDQWYAREKHLPANLNQVLGYDPGLSGFDPVTGFLYEYYPGGDTQYQLCATFAFAGQPDRANTFRTSRFDTHSAGRQCFPLDAVRVTLNR